MLVRVMYHDKKYDMVKDSVLNELINSALIARFYRSDGWVIIGCSPLRGTGGSYSGAERRGVRYRTPELSRTR